MKTQRIQVGNGQYVGVLFVIPVIVEINKHRLDMFTLVSEIFDNVNMVLGIKNLFELEGVIDSRESSFRFLSRSLPIFPREQVNCKARRKEADTNRSSFYRRNIRHGYCQDHRSRTEKAYDVEIKIYKE